MKKWGALAVLGTAQFLMVLDQAVMNVSISQLVDDFDTSVPVIQGVITLYSLTMAALMITGGKIGDIIGRRRAFAIGLVIYSAGSALTAVSWSVAALAIGWSVLEGIGAALVLPALAALIAGSYEGRDRVVAYAVIGGVAGAGIAVGPIVGGWATTELTWRLVFVGEVFVVLGILLAVRVVRDVPAGRRPRLDVVGAVLSAAGMAVIVFGLLQASTWGWIAPKSSPVEPFGFALTPFVVAGGLGLLWLFKVWQQQRERTGRDPLVHLRLFEVRQLRSGLQTFTAQNLILMGTFFTIPLYLQLVQGMDALETGVAMLPVSITMFVTSLAGSRLAVSYSPRLLVRSGLVVILASVLMLMGTVEPVIDSTSFAVAMGLLGVGMGLMASQLGNVVQSAVGSADRSEAGGLQYTAQQLGSAIGVALIGAIVLSGLAQNFVSQISDDEQIDAQLRDSVSVEIEGGIPFVASEDVRTAVVEAGLDEQAADAVVESYEDSQLVALKAGLLAVAIIAAGALFFTGGLPTRTLGSEEDAGTVEAAA